MDDKKVFHPDASNCRDVALDKKSKDGNSSKLQQPTTKQYMTPLIAKARISEITAKLFPNEVKNKSFLSKRSPSSNKNRPSSTSSLAPTIYSTTSATSKQISTHSATSMDSRRSAIPTSKVTGANISSSSSHRHHPPYCAMISANRIDAASSPPSSSSLAYQEGVTLLRKPSHSLLNHPNSHNDNLESTMPIFFPHESLINLAAGTMSSESHIVQTKAYLPNEQGKLQPIPMTMMMVPNQALLALTHQQLHQQQEKLEHSAKIAIADNNISQVDQIPFQLETINTQSESPNLLQKSGNNANSEGYVDPIPITTEPERSASPSLMLSEQLVNSLRISSQTEAPDMPSNLPSRLARRAVAKGRSLLTQEQQQRRLQLQRINLSKFSNSPNNNSDFIPENQDLKDQNDVNIDPSSNFQRQSGNKNPLQVALSKTATSNKQSTNCVSSTSANTTVIRATSPPVTEKVKSKSKQRPVWLSPRYFSTYRPLQKHAWSPSATATSSSARRYDRKQYTLSPNNLDQENENEELDHVSSHNEASSGNTNPDNIEEINQKNEKDHTSEKSELFKCSTSDNNGDKINIKHNGNERDDDGLFGFGKLLHVHSKTQQQSLIKQEETYNKNASNNNESIFSLASPVRTSMILSSISNSSGNDNVDKNNDNTVEDTEKDGCFYPLSAKERRQKYNLHSTKVLEEAIARHQRCRKLFFLHQLRRQVYCHTHQWRSLQRGKLFHENIIRTSHVFSRWIDFTRRKQARRERMLQSKVPLFITKMLVSSTETIVVYLEVNKMKSTFQRWREWTKTHHPCRNKCRYILQYLLEEKLFRAFKKWKRYRDDDKHQLGEMNILSNQCDAVQEHAEITNSSDANEQQKSLNPLLEDMVLPLMLVSEKVCKENEKGQFATSTKPTAINKKIPKQSGDDFFSIDLILNSRLSAPTLTTAPIDVEITQNSFLSNKQGFNVSTQNNDGRKETFEEKRNISSHISDHTSEIIISPLSTAFEVNKDHGELFPQETYPTSVHHPVSVVSSEPTDVSPPTQIIRLNDLLPDFERSPLLPKPSSFSFYQLKQSQMQDELSTLVVDLADGNSSSTISTTLKPSKEYFFSTPSYDDENFDVEDYDSTRINLNVKIPDNLMAVNLLSSVANESGAYDFPRNNTNNSPKNVSNSNNTVGIIGYIPQDVLDQQIVLRNDDRKLSPLPTISDLDDDYFQSSNDPQRDADGIASQQIEKDFHGNNVLIQSKDEGNSMDRLLEMYSSKNDSLLGKKQQPLEVDPKKEKKANLEESRPPMTIKDIEEKVSAIMRSPSEVKITPTSTIATNEQYLENEEIVVDLDDEQEPYYQSHMHNMSLNSATMYDNSQMIHANNVVYSDGNSLDNNVHYYNHLSINQNMHYLEEDVQVIAEEEDIYYEDDFEKLSDENYCHHIPCPQEQYLSDSNQRNHYHNNAGSNYPHYQQMMTFLHANNNRPEHSIFSTEADENYYDDNNMNYDDSNPQYYHNIQYNQEHNIVLTLNNREMDEFDILNHADQYDVCHEQETSLPVYDGEELPLFVENPDRIVSFHDPHSNHSPSHYDALEDSETSFLTGRKAPFAAFQDDDLPPLPNSPYREGIDHELDLETDAIWNSSQENSHNKNIHFSPHFPIEADSSEHPQKMISESRCWTPFTEDELTKNNTNDNDTSNNITKMDDIQSRILLPQNPAEAINDEEYIDELPLRKAEEYYADRRQRIAFYHLVKTLLLKSLQRQVIQQISVPATMRLTLRRGLFHWYEFRSLQKEKRLYQMQMLQQQAADDNYQNHMRNNDVEDDEEEEYYDDEDEYAAYRDYADDHDDVIRIIEISEL